MTDFYSVKKLVLFIAFKKMYIYTVKKVPNATYIAFLVLHVAC